MEALFIIITAIIFSLIGIIATVNSVESKIKAGHPIVIEHKVYRCAVEGEER